MCAYYGAIFARVLAHVNRLRRTASRNCARCVRNRPRRGGPAEGFAYWGEPPCRCLLRLGGGWHRVVRDQSGEGEKNRDQYAHVALDNGHLTLRGELFKDSFDAIESSGDILNSRARRLLNKVACN